MILILLLPLLLGIPFGIVLHIIDPTSARQASRMLRTHRCGRKSKGFIGSLMSTKPAGKMCAPGGVSSRGKRRR